MVAVFQMVSDFGAIIGPLAASVLDSAGFGAAFGIGAVIMGIGPVAALLLMPETLGRRRARSGRSSADVMEQPGAGTRNRPCRHCAGCCSPGIGAVTLAGFRYDCRYRCYVRGQDCSDDHGRRRIDPGRKTAVPEYFLGIDVGGTKIAAGVVDADGEVLSVVKVPTGADRPPTRSGTTSRPPVMRRSNKPASRGSPASAAAALVVR